MDAGQIADAPLPFTQHRKLTSCVAFLRGLPGQSLSAALQLDAAASRPIFLTLKLTMSYGLLHDSCGLPTSSLEHQAFSRGSNTRAGELDPSHMAEAGVAAESATLVKPELQSKLLQIFEAAAYNNVACSRIFDSISTLIYFKVTYSIALIFKSDYNLIAGSFY